MLLRLLAMSTSKRIDVYTVFYYLSCLPKNSHVEPNLKDYYIKYQTPDVEAYYCISKNINPFFYIRKIKARVATINIISSGYLSRKYKNLVSK